jgi:hypothetical protein
MPTVKRILDREFDSQDFRIQISTIAVALNVPAIVIAHYVNEILPGKEEVVNNIKSLQKFYGYEGVEE